MPNFSDNIKFYYKDGSPLPVKNKKVQAKFDDIVDVGEKATFEFYVKNEGQHEFEVTTIKIEDPDAEIDIVDKILRPNTSVRIVIIFTPKRERKRILNAPFKIWGRFVVRE